MITVWLVKVNLIRCVCTRLTATMLGGDFISPDGEMKNLLQRLATFSSLPESAAVFPSILSKAGFYYTGDGDSVACCSCGLCVHFSDIGIDPMRVHRRRSPECPLVSQLPITTEATSTIMTPQQEVTSAIDSPDVELRSATLSNTVCAENTNASSSRGLQNHNGRDSRRRRRNRRHDHYSVLASYAGSNHWPVHHRREPPVSSFSTEPMLNPMLSYETGGSITDVFISMSLISSPLINNDTDNPRRMLERINNNDPTLLDEMKYERRRLVTYANWPADINITPEALAHAGLFYLCRADRVKCAFCFGIMRNWVPSEDPATKHRCLFPSCPFLRDPRAAGNIAVGDEPTQEQMLNVTTNTSSSTGFGELGIQTVRPEHPAMAVEAARLATFNEYPQDNPVSPDSLAHAGFYYIGVSDEVCCFFCGGHIGRWQSSEDPMTKHCHLYPNCGFVRLMAESGHSAETPTTDDSSGPSGTTEQTLLTGASLACYVCKTAERNTVFLPCGHLACCSNCATSRTTCPVCRCDVRGSVHAYLS